MDACVERGNVGYYLGLGPFGRFAIARAINACYWQAPTACAGVAELVDAPDLGSGIERCGGSSPFTRTIDNFLNVWILKEIVIFCEN